MGYPHEHILSCLFMTVLFDTLRNFLVLKTQSVVVIKKSQIRLALEQILLNDMHKMIFDVAFILHSLYGEKYR